MNGNYIAVCGDSGSGKSTLSNLLSNNLGDCYVLECDRYHNWDRHSPNWEKFTHLDINANDLKTMDVDVSCLINKKSVLRKDYDHFTGKFTDPEEIKPKNNLIVCGLHSLYCTSFFDLKVFMDTDNPLRIHWKIFRDSTSRNHSIDFIKKQIEKRKNDYEKYIKPQKYKSDVIVNFYSETEDSVDIAKGLGKRLKILVKNDRNIEGVIRLYKQKNITYKLTRNENYNELEIINSCEINSSHFYDYIIICLLELLKTKCQQ